MCLRRGGENSSFEENAEESVISKPLFMKFNIRLIIVAIASVIPFNLTAKPDFGSHKLIGERRMIESCRMADVPCVPASKSTYTCRQLGMKAKDFSSRTLNTKILVRAINNGYKIKCDNTYFLDGNNGEIVSGIHIVGRGCLIFTDAIKIVANIPEFELDGLTIRSYDAYCGRPFEENVNTAFIFPPDNRKIRIKDVSVRNCSIDNISLIRFQNRSGDHVDNVLIEGKTWNNMSYVGVAIGSTNIDSLFVHKNNAYKINSRLFDFGTATYDIVKKARITNNYLSNKGYFSTTTEFYAGLAVLECEDAICDGNVVEDFLVSNSKVNLYDIYCNCTNLRYTNNRKHNVLNFQDINLLCKAKSFKGGQGSRIVENNSFVVDDDIIDKYRHLITPDCCIKMMTLSADESTQQALISIKNNTINAQVPCSFGMSGGANVKEVHIQNNTINCLSIADGDYYYSGSIEEALVSNNSIVSKVKVSSSSPAMKLKRGNYVLEDCSLSSFPGVLQADVESTVRRCTLMFSYNDKPSPNIALGGMVQDCTIDFQGFDLADNYNIYLSKAKNPLAISDLSVKNAPKRGTLWLRYLLDRKRSADYLDMEIGYANHTNRIMIDNVNHTVSVLSRKYSIQDNKQSVDLPVSGANTIRLSFYGDRLGITELSDNMKISIREIVRD